MSYFEGNGKCDVREFERFRPQRLTTSELHLSEIYTLMLSYKYDQRERLARRFATTVTGLVVVKPDIVQVDFCTLDLDFRPVSDFRVNFDRSGEWLSPSGAEGSDHNLARIEGYFKGYEHGVPPVELLGYEQAELLARA